MSGPRPNAASCRAALLALLLPAALPAQGAPPRCRLDITAPVRRSERDSGQEGAFVTHLSGGVTATCGDARMTGDSAVHVEQRNEARMLGHVRYQDTTRTLAAQRLTFYGATDRVVAEGDVRLERLRTGARLEGPRVDFLRTPGTDTRTLATGRPRMFLPGASKSAEPFIVDADEAEFVGEERAFARGDVEMHRSDLTASGDSARFDGAAGTGVLYGRPVVDSRGLELTGDSVVAGFAADELRDVEAFESAEARGERFDLRSDRIRARLADGQPERVWAFGAGRSLGKSEGFVLAGDSLDFAFTGGSVDSVTAVGDAAAEETGTPVEAEPQPPAEPVLGTDPGGNWLAGDTIRGWFEPAPDSGSGESEPDGIESRPVQARRLVATGDARSFYAAVRDSTRSEEPSRNYVIGEGIEVLFKDGRASEVRARDAIGVYLEPLAGGEGG